MDISFGHSDEAWKVQLLFIEKLVDEYKPARILEIGAGANPTFNLEYVNDKNIEYTLLDISAEELEKAPTGYKKIVADITQPDLSVNGEYDLVFSRMLAEHVKDGRQFHRNIYALLSNNGLAFHFFPTLYAFPFVINKLIPERLSVIVLNLFQPGRESSGKHAKFPAYYSWCRGPTRMQLKRLKALGYKVVLYSGFFGHEGYYQKLPVLQWLHNKLSHWLVKHPAPSLTSYAYVLLKK